MPRRPLRATLGRLHRTSLVVLFALAFPACTPSGPSFRPARDREARAPIAVAEPVPDLAPPSAPAPAPAPAPPSPSPSPAAEPSRDGWNTAQIDWQPYEAGLARARAENRPVVVVMHADWCVHCRNYSHVFEDPRIVERARSLVMVRVDTDAEPDVARRFQLDGGYVPRTYFLAPDGTVRAEIDARRPQYRYFFHESDPTSLLAAMDTALGRS